VQILVADTVRGGDRDQQVVSTERHRLRTGHVGQQDHEFIAAVTTYCVRPAHTRHQSTGD